MYIIIYICNVHLLYNQHMLSIVHGIHFREISSTVFHCKSAIIREVVKKELQSKNLIKAN